MKKETVKYLYSLMPKDFRMNLMPMVSVCEDLGNPQKKFRSIHIVGTNGKGSTAAFLSSLLQEAGLKVGLISSPHLTDLRERIQINRELISFQALESLIKRVKKILPTSNYLSFFEMMMLLGFAYFEQEKVDVAIVEAGLGGRLDASNVLNPELIIMTSIGMDHQQFLGKTLSEIAKEKAAVFKPFVPVISAPQEASVMRVLQKADDLTIVAPLSREISLGLQGAHQRINAALALEAAKKILPAGRINLKTLSKCRWPGRLEFFGKNQNVVLDGAHNPEAMKALVSFLKEKYPKRSFKMLFSVMKDKNWEEMLSYCVNFVDYFYFTEISSPRSLKVAELVKWAMQSEKSYEIITNHSSFLKEASVLPKNEVLVIAGSLYLVGRSRSILASSFSFC